MDFLHCEKPCHHVKNYDNFPRVFEKANQLLTSHSLYLLPCINGNSFSF